MKTIDTAGFHIQIGVNYYDQFYTAAISMINVIIIIDANLYIKVSGINSFNRNTSIQNKQL